MYAETWHLNFTSVFNRRQWYSKVSWQGKVYRLDSWVALTVWFISECPQEAGLGKALWEVLSTYSCPTGWRTPCYLGEKQSRTMIPTPLMTKCNGERGASLVPLELWGLCSLPQNHVRPKWWPSRWLTSSSLWDRQMENHTLRTQGTRLLQVSCKGHRWFFGGRILTSLMGTKN